MEEPQAFGDQGQKGIRILAPIVRKNDADATEAPIVRILADGKTAPTGRIAGFRVATVFDLSQTEGEPLPSLGGCNATEGGDELLPLIEQAIAGLSISLTYKALSGPYGLSRGGAIEIEESLDTPGRCGVLLHELAHELIHKANRAETTKQQRELEAESTAYAVMAHFGLQLPSQIYLATYGVTAELLTGALQTISATTKRIVGLLTPPSANDKEEDAGDPGVSSTFALPLAA